MSLKVYKTLFQDQEISKGDFSNPVFFSGTSSQEVELIIQGTDDNLSYYNISVTPIDISGPDDSSVLHIAKDAGNGSPEAFSQSINNLTIFGKGFARIWVKLIQTSNSRVDLKLKLNYRTDLINTGTYTGLQPSLLAGPGDGTRGFVDGIGTAARFDGLGMMACDPDGIIWLCDLRNNAIRRIDPVTSEVTTLASGGLIVRPIDLCVHPTSRNIYVSCNMTGQINSRILKITPGGTVTQITGSAKQPRGIAVNAAETTLQVMEDGENYFGEGYKPSHTSFDISTGARDSHTIFRELTNGAGLTITSDGQVFGVLQDSRLEQIEGIYTLPSAGLRETFADFWNLHSTTLPNKEIWIYTASESSKNIRRYRASGGSLTAEESLWTNASYSPRGVAVHPSPHNTNYPRIYFSDTDFTNDDNVGETTWIYGGTGGKQSIYMLLPT